MSEQFPNWRDLPFYADKRAHWGRLVKTGRFPRVTLLEGRRGLGKRQLASQLAAMPFCTSRQGCGVCQPCLDVLSGQHPELLWIESEDGKLKVESAQALQEHLTLQPASGMPVRLVVLVRCEELLNTAAGRLLKILEEPPAKAQIIMTTDSPRALLPTILSRTVRMRVTPPPQTESARYVRSLSPDSSDEAIESALRRHGMVPAFAARWLASGSDESIYDEIFGLDFRAAGELVARKKDLRLDQLLEQWEYRLCDRYRRQGADVSSLRMQQRRAFIRRIRSLAVRAKVPLNKQLLVEQIRIKQGC